MKKISLMIFLAMYPSSHLCLAQVAKQGNDVLSAFLGKWEGKGTSKDSAYSKAGPNSAQTNCDWSPNRGFLVCEQIVHLPDGTTQNDLSIYTYNETDHSYAFYGLSRNNSNVRTPKLTIEDKRWTYSGEFENNGKTSTISRPRPASRRRRPLDPNERRAPTPDVLPSRDREGAVS